MNGIPYLSLGDYIDHTLANFYKRPKVHVTMTLQDYTMYNWLFKQVAENIKSGKRLEWRYMRNHSGEAVATSPFQILPTVYRDLWSTGYSNWTQCQKRATWNEMVAGDMGGEAELADEMDKPILDVLWGSMDYLENSPFRVKQNSSDLVTPDGIPFWFPKLAAGYEDTTGSFVGGSSTHPAAYADGTTTSTIGGTDRSVVTQARTAVGTYNGVNAGMLDTLRHLQNITNFKVPTDVQQYVAASKAKWRLISGFTAQEQYEALVNAGPDDRNGDANPFAGELTFRGMKWERVAAMNDLADSPIYGINSSQFFPFRHAKFWNYWTKTDSVPGDTQTLYKDLFFKFNFAAVKEKEAGFCLHRVRAA